MYLDDEYVVAEGLGIYTTSLGYIDEQRCTVGYPGQGLKTNVFPRKVEQYVRHKERRKMQSRKGSLTAGELVYSLHGDVPDGMFEMALEPFTAGVLWKLAEDCKVGFELAGGNRRWLLNERAGEFESLKH